VTVVFIIILTRIRLTPQPQGDPAEGFLAQLRAGFVHVRRSRPLMLVLAAMFAGGACVRAVIELMPAIAALSFVTAASGLAVLTGAAAIGAIVAGLSVRPVRPSRLLTEAPLWWGLGALAAVALTQAHQPWLAAVAAASLGAAITRGLVCTQTFIQLTTPDEMRGRTLGVFGLMARGSPALGALAIGYGADALGMGQAVLLASACLVALLAALALPIRRTARTLDTPP
jgi:hypothetical protein